jgi:hypothetical protein
MSYNNADGLLVLTDGAQGAVNNTGSAEYGPKFLVINIPNAPLIGSATTSPAANDAFIPAGAYITKASLIVTTAFVGATAALNIGLQTLAGSAIDADGIDVAIAVTAIDAIGDVVACNGALVAGVLTVGTANAYVSFDYDTAAFTAGAGKLVIEYIG